MGLLLFYVCLALGGSFICSIMEGSLEKLEDEGYTTIVPIRHLNYPQGETQLLVIDGDDTKKTSTVLASMGTHADFHVVVTQLGIETLNHYNEDDLELLIDGIRAACTVTDGPTPRFNCPCCG